MHSTPFLLVASTKTLDPLFDHAALDSCARETSPAISDPSCLGGGGAAFFQAKFFLSKEESLSLPPLAMVRPILGIVY